MMKLTKVIKLFTLTLILANSYAEDFGQTVPGSIPNAMEDVKVDGESVYIPDGNERPLDKVEKKKTSALVPGEEDYGTEVSGKGSPSQFNSGAPFSGLDSDSYITYTNKDILKGLAKKSKSSFSFEFFQNNFDYTDTRGVYSKTFDSDSGAKGGSLHISMDRYLYKGFLNFGYGGGLGVGYSTGKGIFADDNTVSKTRFNLYSLPIDLRLLIELPIGEVVKLSFAGGPSVMGLIQNRSDRDDGDKDKERRQVGYGYSAEGKLKLNLGHLFTDTGFEYYRTHEVSFMSIDLAIRTQNYSGFADEVEISGMSYGLGFTFEFL
ncbi:hypothetical protein [Halobacteriovorax sp. JY17]|uniref:hypothetical protein n=1 Tax=Halobacteriovorax sp. JY17 TaxID=2014617 RepID=UPI000C4F05A7|nr:hypothetical protein [Halobacteriovorax sp. JY17]PIK14579.1 MAG: hypothetical protein CES88_09575 [Halobacteriovorax sp. JY17]